MSPLFLEYLMGRREYKCTPWGMPTYNIFGWQKPCYLLQDGYADTFKELIGETNWDNYGTESGNPKCANCMVHSGYEASAVNDTFGSLRRLPRHGEGDAVRPLQRSRRRWRSPAAPQRPHTPLVQIGTRPARRASQDFERAPL